jgi:hypothetical protein
MALRIAPMLTPRRLFDERAIGVHEVQIVEGFLGARCVRHAIVKLKGANAGLELIRRDDGLRDGTGRLGNGDVRHLAKAVQAKAATNLM